MIEEILTFGVDGGPLNNREIATLLWLSIGFIFVLAQPKARTIMISTIPILMKPVILISFAILTAWATLLVAVGSQLALWDRSLLKETVIWYLTTAAVMYFNVNEALKDRHHFRRVVLSIVTASLVIEFVLGKFVLPLFIELVLQPILILLSVMSVLASRESSTRAAKRLLDSILAMVGLLIASYAGYRLITDWDEVATWNTARELILPVWLTAGLVPYLFLLAVYASYESAVLRMRYLSKRDRIPIWGTVALVTNIRLQFHNLAGFGGKWAADAGSAQTLGEAASAIESFLSYKRAKREAEEEREYLLKKYAGTHATGDDGRQLDRREFAETKQALFTLSGAQMGWYRNRGNRYREELLDILQPRFERDGLPTDHGVILQVSTDGQAWWAWRRTVTGWCFAIGAAGPPPDQWTYDGPEPPSSFPGDDEAWGDKWGSHALNW